MPLFLRSTNHHPLSTLQDSSRLHLINPQRLQTFQKFLRAGSVKFLILRFNAQKEPVAAGACEALDVEYWMIGLRQTIQGEHAEHRDESSNQNRRFKSDGNKRRPAIERPAADVEGVVNHRGVIL